MASIQNLTSLLETSDSAREYFNTLPLDTQLAINRNSSDITTVEELQQCANTIFHTGGTVM